MTKKMLRGTVPNRFDQERADLEVRLAELRKREEEQATKQQLLIGSVMLDLVASGRWTEAQLHELLRPHLKRKKDFATLGMVSDLVGPEGDEDTTFGSADVS